MDEGVICRLCLETVPTGYTIFKEDIQNIIKVLTAIEVSVNDNLPKLSCSKCILNLYFVENVRKVIIKSDEKLRAVVSRGGNINEFLKPIIPRTADNSGDINCDNDAEVKEERASPANSPTEIRETEASDYDSNITSDINIDVQQRTCIDDVLDENDITKIIYKKDNNKPYLYHCNVCNVDFRGNALYIKHKGKHVKKTCEICGVTTRLDNFKKHMMIHKLGQQVCDICGSIHKSLEGLRSHLFHFHNANKKMYKCEECGELFKYSYRLAYHKRKVHMGFRPHQCDACGKSFFDLGTMKKHVKLIHLKLREHHCNYCKKNYSSQYALKVHIRQHTDETPYVCEICTEGFRQLVSLKTHMAKHERASTRKDQDKNQEEIKEEKSNEVEQSN